MNNSKNYFKQMRGLKTELMYEFSSVLERLGTKYPLLSENAEFSMFYNKRIFNNTVLLRPFITKTFLSMDSSEIWKQHKSLLALVEFVNISTYQSNIVFDSKDEAIGDKSNNFIISSIFSKLLVSDTIQLSNYSDADKLFIFRTVTECLKDLYYGQYLDTNVLIFSNQELSNDFTKLNTAYIERCHLLGGSLITMCANIALHFNPNLKKIKDDLKMVAQYFGTAGQILNDIGDLVAENRTYSTQKFSDIKNERLTLPIYFTNELFKCYYDKESIIKSMGDLDKITQLKRKMFSEIIKPYIHLINERLDAIKDKGFDVSELLLVINLLSKSGYILN